MARHGNVKLNHLAKSDVYRVWVAGRFQHFTFSEDWGPLLTDEWGDPVNNDQLSNESDPFWTAFEGWMAAGKPRDFGKPSQMGKANG